MNKPQRLKTASNSVPNYQGGITIKSPKELEAVRRAGSVVGATLALLQDTVEPGMTTRDLDLIAEKNIRKLGGKPTFKGYRGFPASICASVNNEIVHGIPGDRILNAGDILKMDVGATVDGFIGDAAITVGVGEISLEAKALINLTKQCLEKGIQATVAGGRIGDIGAAIEELALSHGYSVVREYVGHGVGRFLHEDPPVPNFGPPNRGPLLQEGMVLAIEPMVNIGEWKTKLLEDQWTVVTADGSLSAHFEHTIGITNGKPTVFTSLQE